MEKTDLKISKTRRIDKYDSDNGYHIAIIVSELIRQGRTIVRTINILDDQITEKDIDQYRHMFLNNDMPWLSRVSIFYDSHPYELNHLNSLNIGDIFKFDLIIMNGCDMIQYDLFDDLEEISNLWDRDFDERNYLIGKAFFHIQKKGVIYKINKISKPDKHNKTTIKLFVNDMSDDDSKLICRNVTFTHLYGFDSELMSPGSYRAKMWIGVD